MLDLKLVCARFLYETFLVPALLYGSKKIWIEKEISRIRDYASSKVKHSFLLDVLPANN